MALLWTPAAPCCRKVLSRSSLCEGQAASQIARGVWSPSRAVKGACAPSAPLSNRLSQSQRAPRGCDFVHSLGDSLSPLSSAAAAKAGEELSDKGFIDTSGWFLLESTSFSAEGFEVLPLFFQACYFFFPSLKMIDKILESHLLVQTE